MQGETICEVHHGWWVESWLVGWITAREVNHLWGTPWLVGWTTTRGVDHLWGTSWLMKWTTFGVRLVRSARMLRSQRLYNFLNLASEESQNWRHSKLKSARSQNGKESKLNEDDTLKSSRETRITESENITPRFKYTLDLERKWTNRALQAQRESLACCLCNLRSSNHRSKLLNIVRRICRAPSTSCRARGGNDLSRSAKKRILRRKERQRNARLLNTRRFWARRLIWRAFPHSTLSILLPVSVTVFPRWNW